MLCIGGLIWTVLFSPLSGQEGEFLHRTDDPLWHGFGVPKTLDSVEAPPDPTQIFQFNMSERSSRSYPHSPIGTSNITLDAPWGYNSTFVNMSLLVMNASLNATTIVDFPPESTQYSNVEQSQGFSTSSDVFLSDFSVYLLTVEPPLTTTIQLRMGAYNGPAMAFIPIIFTGGSWVNITLTPAIFLPLGHYYFYMPAFAPALNAWRRTPKGAGNGGYGDAWVNTGGTWERQQWNLTLQINTYQALSPSSVGMAVGSHPVADAPNGRGWVNISQDISASPLVFPVGNSTPIAFSSEMNATYYRVAPVNVTISTGQDLLTWTLGIPPSEQGYANYLANVTGFREDYLNIQAMYGSDEVPFSPHTYHHHSHKTDRPGNVPGS